MFMKSFRTRKAGFGILLKTLWFFRTLFVCYGSKPQIHSFVFFNSSVTRKSNFFVTGDVSAPLRLLLFGCKPKANLSMRDCVQSNTWQQAYALPYFDIPCIGLRYILIGFYPMNSDFLVFKWCASPRYTYIQSARLDSPPTKESVHFPSLKNYFVLSRYTENVIFSPWYKLKCLSV